MLNRKEWVAAYARQAQADLLAYESMASGDAIPNCQQLHFLQMACEKYCKASLLAQGAPLKNIRSSHAYIGKTLPLQLRLVHWVVYKRVLHTKSDLFKQFKHLSREIELLAPAVDDGGARPDNCEYPWEDATGAVHVPIDFKFPVLALLTKTDGKSFLKLVESAVDELCV